MKLKKIVSALLAFSMVSAMGIMNVSAADYEKPVIHVDSEVFTGTATNYKPVEGYTTYLVSYSMEGIDYSTGNSITGWTVDYTVAGDYLDKSFLKPVTGGAPAARDINGVYKTSSADVFMFGDKQIVLACATGLWDHIDWDTYASGSPANVKTLPLVQALVYVKDDSSVSFTYNTAIVDSQTSSKIELADGTAFDDEIVYNVNGKETNTLVLNGPVVTGTDDADDVTVTADLKGKVWNGIKIEDVTKGTNYQVKFSDDKGNVTYDLDLNGKEVNGDIDFAVVLKTAKDLANITMDILFDLAE